MLVPTWCVRPTCFELIGLYPTFLPKSITGPSEEKTMNRFSQAMVPSAMVSLALRKWQQYSSALFHHASDGPLWTNLVAVPSLTRRTAPLHVTIFTKGTRCRSVMCPHMVSAGCVEFQRNVNCCGLFTVSSVFLAVHNSSCSQNNLESQRRRSPAWSEHLKVELLTHFCVLPCDRS